MHSQAKAVPQRIRQAPLDGVEHAIQRSELCRNAIRSLEQRGIALGEIIEPLCLFVALDNQPRNPSVVMEVSSRGTGKTFETFEYFPQRVNGLADEAQKVNEAVPIFDERFSALPGLLREYARFLTEYAESERDCSKIDVQTWRDGANEALARLDRTMRRKLGRPAYRVLADLLTATAVALGVQCQYDEDVVKMRLRRS